VTGETVKGAIEWIRRIRKSISSIATIDALKDWVLSNESFINKNPSAWCAVESALIDLIGKERGRTVNELFEIPATLSNQKITAVISDGTINFVESLLVKCLKFGFTDFKIKLTGIIAKDCAKTTLLRKYITEGCSVRVDFNNAFSSKDIDGFVRYLHKLNYSFSAFEEPFEPYAASAMRQIATKFDVPIILDESFLTAGDIKGLNGNDRFIPNIRISKLGGLVKTLRLVELASQNEIPIILGSLVGETSILARLWLVVAAYCPSTIYAAEGAYTTHLLEDDITKSPIVVKPPGVVDVPETILNSPGLGIEISPEAQKYLDIAGQQPVKI